MMQRAANTYSRVEDVEPDRDELTALRRRIHQHPELSHQEVESRVREQVVVSAGITVDAGKAMMRIPALDETLDDLFLHRAPQPARFAKFLAMAHRATATAGLHMGRAAGIGQRAQRCRAETRTSHPCRASQRARQHLVARMPDKELEIVNNRPMPDICVQHLLAVMLIDGTFKSAHDFAPMKNREIFHPATAISK
jgi:hypothetical protein